MDNPKVAEQLARLKDKDWRVSTGAFKALRQMGVSAVPALIIALKDKDSRVREGAAAALGSVGARAVPPLIKALKEENQGDIQWKMAAAALAKIDNISLVVKVLFKELEDTQENDGQWLDRVAFALGRCCKYSVYILVDALYDRNEDVRLGAGLHYTTGHRLYSAPLPPPMNYSNENVRLGAAKSLVQIGPVAVPKIVKTLEDRHYDSKMVADIFNNISKKSIEWLESVDLHMRCYGAEALGMIGDIAAVPALIVLLKDKHWSPRWYAADALRRLGDSETLPRKILAESCFSAEKRINVLESLRQVRFKGQAPTTSQRLTLRYTFPETRELCLAVLNEDDDATREGAQSVLNWINGGQDLLRAAHGGRDLLRAAHGGNSKARPDTLLRAIDIPETVGVPLQRRRTFWQRLFGKRKRANS